MKGAVHNQPPQKKNSSQISPHTYTQNIKGRIMSTTMVQEIYIQISVNYSIHKISSFWVVNVPYI